MGSRDPRIDAYIEKAEPFARPILNHLRNLIHEAYPAISETIKWGAPVFEHKGQVAMLASFKEHIGMGFRKDKLMRDPHHLFGSKEDAIGSLGKIKSLKDLPADKVIIEYVKEAVQLNETGAKVPVKKTDFARFSVPDDFAEKLKTDARAAEGFNALTPGYQKEYVDWFNEAKTAATREKRMNTAMEWAAEGKSLNWRYKK